MADSILQRKFGGSLINSLIHSNLSICNSTRREQNKPHGNNKKKTKDLDEKQKLDEIARMSCDEAAAQAAALAQVSAMFQRPEQLEKLDAMRKRAERKLAAVEAMLRTGVQSQLEGIRTALGQLQTASEDVKSVETNLEEVWTTLQRFPALRAQMTRLRDANIVHSQYAAAMDNLRHIFHLSETVEEAREALVDCKILVAHKHLMELENARDDLMFEVHKQAATNEYDKNLLKNYFVDVERLGDEIGKQVFYICARALEACRGADPGPQQLVSAIRIIEREERIDAYYAERVTAHAGFMPPARPRRWRQTCFDTIEATVRHRIEGNQLDDRTTNKQWLARYLEVCRRIVLDDLRVAKSGVVPCFPPEYQIYDRFVGFYHNCLSRRLREIAAEKLEKNELVQLLSWVHAYGSEQLLGAPRLQINAVALLHDHPVLPRSTVTKLCDDFVEITRKDVREWLEKTLTQEKDEWYKHVRPESESQGYFYTQLPSILFGMVEDTVALTKEISLEIIPGIVDVIMEEFLDFANRYRDAATAYKTKHFENRSFFKEFTPTIIAIANNLDICVDSTDKLKKHIRLTMESDTGGGSVVGTMRGVNRQELLSKIDRLKSKWNSGIEATVGTLLEEVYQDISPHLAEILTKKWLGSNDAVETICATVADYDHDHRHLRPHIRCSLLMELQYKLVGEYLVAFESGRISFRSYDEQNAAAERLRWDASRIEKMFKQLLFGTDMTLPMLVDVLAPSAEVIGLRDKSLLSLEVSGFVRRFPDVHAELVAAVIQSREDVGRAEAKQLADEILGHVKFHPKGDPAFRKLFALSKAQGKPVPPAIEQTMQGMFATLTAMSATMAKTPGGAK